MAKTGTKTIGWTSLVLATWFLTLGGCDDTELQKAKQEAIAAKAEVSRLQLRLGRAESRIQEMKTENNSVREMRDTLHDRVIQLAKENEKAASLATQAQQTATALNAKAETQADTTTSLTEQITTLKALVAQQQATIQQYLSTIQEQQTLLEAVQQYVSQQAAAAQNATDNAGDAADVMGTGGGAGGQ